MGTSTIESSKLLGSIEWGFPTWDLFIVIFFVVGVVLYGLTLGRERIVLILINIYVSYAIANHLPFINESLSRKFGFGPVYIMKICVFIAMMVFLFFLFNKLGMLTGLEGKPNIIHIGIYSVLHVGLLIAIILSLLPYEATSSLSNITYMVFVSNIGRFFWLLAPIGAMFLLKKPAPAED